MQQTAHVFAYLDAGTGSMLLQILLGGAAAVGVAGRVLWQRVRGRAPKTDASGDEASLTEDTDDAAREEIPALDSD